MSCTKDFFNEDKAKYPRHDFSKRQEILIKSVRGEAGSAVYYLTDNTGQFTKMIMAYRPINIIDGVYSISLYTNYNSVLQPARQYALKLIVFILLIISLFIIVIIFLFRISKKYTKFQTEALYFKNIAKKTGEIKKQKNEFKALYEEYKNLNTELIIAKEEVEKNEKKYKTLVENQGEGLIMVNLNETITFANPAAERIFETDKLVGINLSEFVLGDQLQLIRTQTKDRVKGEKSSYELDIELKNHIKKSLLVTATPIFEGEKVIQTLGLFRDITKLKTIEKNLIKLTTAVEQSANMVIITDANGTIEYVNKEFSKVSGYSKNEVIGKNPNILKSGKHSDAFYQKLWRTIKSKKEWKGEIQNKKKNGELYWESAIIAPVLNNNGDIINFIIIKEDITERKLYEKKMFDAIVKTEEREKKRFAVDLHDGLGPILSAAKIYAEALKSENNTRVKKQILKKFEQVINEAIASTQEIANNISPHILKNFGLTAAINSFCSKISGTLISIGVASNTENRFNEDVEISLYRVLIELINNTLKHADASLIKINIKEEKQDLFIRYIDNGVGFDVKKVMAESEGMGIKNIINRINFINGKIDIKSDLNKGTLIEITIPLIRREV